jgi:hypothetical protein
MNLHTRRWLIAPVRQWRTHRLLHRHGPSLDYTTAWSLIALAGSPHEFAFVRQAVQEAEPTADAGLHHDTWRTLAPRERRRRRRWLARHDSSPIQQLDITEVQILSAGLRVVDWGPPEGDD